MRKIKIIKAKPGDIVGFEEANFPREFWTYGEVIEVYKTKYGGHGIEIKGLNGWLHKASMPENRIKQIIRFNDLQEAQDHINQRELLSNNPQD